MKIKIKHLHEKGVASEQPNNRLLIYIEKYEIRREVLSYRLYINNCKIILLFLRQHFYSSQIFSHSASKNYGYWGL
ncbi:hypothetical protein J2T03_002278 [Chryseobacterium lathyri]|nr:hypothetical protein [Chryseobacterium lathyri]